MTKLSEVNRYYLYFSSALMILIISLLVEVDPLYIAAFLLPIFFAMLFAHPNVDNFKQYEISRFSFVNLLFYLEKRFSLSDKIKFSTYINRHIVALILFFLLTISMTVNFIILYLFFFAGVGFFEVIYFIYQKRKSVA